MAITTTYIQSIVSPNAYFVEHPMITYSTNWMGPVSLDWYRKRGLLEEGSVEPTTYYSAGRIDIRDDTKHGYDGWDEHSLAPMHGEDWNDFSEWLESFQTNELWELEDIVKLYESASGRKIRWWEDKTELLSNT